MTTQINVKQINEYLPDYAVPPGQTLLEIIENIPMTQKDLAIRIGLTEQTIDRILNGVQPISYETANKLEMVTGVPARFWNNLEMQYQEQLSKIKQIQELKKSIDWLHTIPINELITRGVVPNVKSKEDLLNEALKFYGVSSVKSWNKIWCDPKVAARRSDCFDANCGFASAWIRLGELQAQEIVCKPFNKNDLKNSLQGFRSLTTKEPEVFITEMRNLCAEMGIGLALVRKFKNVPWDGASKWLSKTKVMILLNLRGKGEDIFWFSFFHEIYHVLYGKKRQLYIAEDNSKDIEEQKADRFAANFLIPEKYNSQIINFSSNKEIVDFSKSQNISPGIVAGRYRFLTKKWSYFKDLTKTFDCVEKK